VASAVTTDGSSQTDYMIGQKYISLLGDLTSQAATTTMFLPWEAGACAGLIENLADVFGSRAPRGKLAGAPLTGPGPLPQIPYDDSDAESTQDDDGAAAVVGGGDVDSDSDPDADVDDKIGGFTDLD
jgi:hypothetical protein